MQLFHQLDTDLEFVKYSGKSCRIPQTAAEFEWNGEAVKSLCVQGDLCIHLHSDFSRHVPEISDESDDPSDPSEVAVEVYDTKRPHTVEIPSPCPCSSTNPISPLPLSPAVVDDCKPGPSSVADLTDLTSYSPSYTCRPQSGYELPEIALMSCKQSVVTTDDFYHIFAPTFSKPCVDAIIKLSMLDRTAAMNFSSVALQLGVCFNF